MAEIRIRDQGKITVQDSDSSNEVSLQAPSTVASNQTFVLPNTDGNNNDVVKTDASGNLSFVDIDTVLPPGISWQTGDIKTSDFIVGVNTGIFVDTSSGPVTATISVTPTAGDFIAFKDYAGTFATNNFTINPNGQKIQGSTNNSVIKTNRASVVLQFIDSTKGFLYIVENNVGDLEHKLYVTATGGTVTTSGDYKIHTFTSSGTFTVSSAGNAAGSNEVSYVVVAGAGGGNNANFGVPGGAGGAGGYREAKSSADPYSASPIAATSGFPVTAQAYPITVGAGGGGGPSPSQTGSNSVFSTITSAGGGGGGVGSSGGTGGAGVNGGSGGGGGSTGTNPASPNLGAPGSGNTPPVSPPQGNNGGQAFAFQGHSFGSGGGGGATAVGDNGGPGQGGAGGAGATSSINGTPTARAGGGGGGGRQPLGGDGSTGSGGSGGGGNGGNASTSAIAGTANTGGGGGGSAGSSSSPSAGQAGGSGVVIIRYKYQN